MTEQKRMALLYPETLDWEGRQLQPKAWSTREAYDHGLLSLRHRRVSACLLSG